VRTFGLLTGSLDPESHACSVQGVDFFLLVVVIIFNGRDLAHEDGCLGILTLRLQLACTRRAGSRR
jgi:hypothetical protein